MAHCLYPTIDGDGVFDSPHDPLVPRVGAYELGDRVSRRPFRVHGGRKILVPRLGAASECPRQRREAGSGWDAANLATGARRSSSARSMGSARTRIGVISICKERLQNRMLRPPPSYDVHPTKLAMLGAGDRQVGIMLRFLLVAALLGDRRARGRSGGWREGEAGGCLLRE